MLDVKEEASSRNPAIEAGVKYLLEIRRWRGRYRFVLHDHLAPRLVLEFTLSDWWPVVDYLSTDPKYARGEDYEIVSVDGKPAKIIFHNTHCAERTIVYLLSILGVDNNKEWVDDMKHAIIGLPIDAVWFWFGTAYDWFVTRKDGFDRWQALMRIARAIRMLYGR